LGFHRRSAFIGGCKRVLAFAPTINARRSVTIIFQEWAKKYLAADERR
jgi:hypothetical protein